MVLEVSEAAKRFLASEGYDPVFGARPLKRAIQQYLLNPMSRAIVAGGYGAGDVVKVDAEPGEEGVITFERIPAPDEDEDSDATNTAEPKALPAPKGE